MIQQKSRRFLRFVVVLATLQVLGLVLYRSVERHRANAKHAAFEYEKLAPPTLLPSMTFEDSAGRPITLPSQEDRPVLLHFWATWCAPCRAELPSLLAHSKLGNPSTKPRLVLVSLDESWSVVGRYFDDAIPPEVVRDPSRVAERKLGVETLPETLLLRADGKAAARIRGARNWQTEAALSTVAGLVRSPN